jgi:DNA-binding NarL/FixJ family response regulator
VSDGGSALDHGPMHATPPEPAGHIRVVIVDADDLVSQTVAALVGIGGRIEVVGIAGAPGPAIELVLSRQPDVVLVDPRLPDLPGGLAFIRRLHTVAPATRVLVICSPDFLEQAAGAEGVDRAMRKTYRPDDLTAAIVAASRTISA